MRDRVSRAAHVNESRWSSQIEPFILSKRAICSYVLSKRAVYPCEKMYDMQHMWMTATYPLILSPSLTLKKSRVSSQKEPYILMLFQKEPSACEKWCITCNASKWEPYFISKRATYPLKKSHIFLCSFERVIREWEVMYYTQHMWIRAIHPLKKSHIFLCSFKRVIRAWEVMHHTQHMWIRAIHPLKKSHIFWCSFKRVTRAWEVMHHTQHMWMSHVHTAICTLKKKPCVIWKRALSQTEPWSSQKEPYSPLKKSPISSQKEPCIISKRAHNASRKRSVYPHSDETHETWLIHMRSSWLIREWVASCSESWTACWWRDARTTHSWMSWRVKFVTQSWMSSSWLTHSLMSVQGFIHEWVTKTRTDTN